MLYRFQNVEFMMSKLDAAMQPFSKDPRDRAAARTYVRRCWLRPGDFRGQCWTLFQAGIQGDIAPLLRRSHNDAGLLSDAYALDYLNSILLPGANTTPRLFAIQEEFARGYPEPSPVQIQSLYEKDFAPLTNFARARALEKVYWQSQESAVESRVFDNYVMAGGYNSARRFYLRARGNINDAVFFGNVAHGCFMLAWLLHDDDTMKLALQDDATGSAYNLQDMIYACAMKEEYPKMDRVAAAYTERYETQFGDNGIGRRLRGFIPLIPALADPKNIDHLMAIDYWGKDASLPIFQWILSRKYNLSADETARFLGGEEADPFRRVLILYARGDKAGIRAAWNDFVKSRQAADRGALVLASYLANDLAPETGEKDESDLMPPGTVFIADAVKAELAR